MSTKKKKKHMVISNCFPIMLSIAESWTHFFTHTHIYISGKKRAMYKEDDLGKLSIIFQITTNKTVKLLASNNLDKMQ